MSEDIKKESLKDSSFAILDAMPTVKDCLESYLKAYNKDGSHYESFLNLQPR